jgi:hypothetical protein
MNKYEKAAQEAGWAITYEDGEKIYYHAEYMEWRGTSEALCYFHDLQLDIEDEA